MQSFQKVVFLKWVRKGAIKMCFFISIYLQLPDGDGRFSGLEEVLLEDGKETEPGKDHHWTYHHKKHLKEHQDNW